MSTCGESTSCSRISSRPSTRKSNGVSAKRKQRGSTLRNVAPHGPTSPRTNRLDQCSNGSPAVHYERRQAAAFGDKTPGSASPKFVKLWRRGSYMCKTIKHKVHFKAPPETIYDLLADSR